MKQHEISATGFQPQADPLLAALTMNAGTGVGQFDPTAYQQASPIRQLIAQALSTGQIDQRDFRLLQGGLQVKPEDAAAIQGLTGGARKKKLRELGYTNAQEITKGLDIANRFAANAGYQNLQGLIDADKAYMDKLPALQAQYQPVADQLRSGLLASQNRVGQYLQNLPNLLTGEANPFIDELNREALHTSQKYGVNPYQFLEQARSTALQRALQLVAGEQGVQSGQQAMALPVAQLRQQGGATAANVGAGQAAALAAALQSGNNAQANQAAQWGQVGNTIGQFGLIGADMYLDSQKKGPGTA